MKLGKQKKEEVTSGGLGKPALNAGKRSSVIVALIVITIALIVFVIMMGQKAQETVEVAVLAKSVYKNQVITKDVIEPYMMLKAEYEKMSIVNEDGSKTRRVMLYDEADKVLNSFAAYPLQKGMYAEYRCFVKSRVDNTDSVLYSFPGKEIVPLDVGSTELNTFKTFIQPGDKLNIVGIFKDTTTKEYKDYNGQVIEEEVESVRTETVFNDIMVADLLNSDGSSVLDIYASYNDKTVWEQAIMDSDPSFVESTEPASLLVALTPEERDRYYYYKTKGDIEFKMSLPQRVS